jgi:DNA uptake protein ComE-like DNA-binding protein
MRCEKYFCSGQLKMPPKASGTNETKVNINTAKRISTITLPAPSPSPAMI